ncbi:MAG: hypothetical protein HY042_08295, partial [Spirochaetia bacterium]|nr:hypothetical protein [Spirochaetia bacterium]
GSPGGDQSAEGEIVLLGVIAGSDQFARAAIQMQGKNDVTEYKVGQTVAGFKIAAIGSSYIMVERGSSQLKIVIGQKSGEARAPGTTQATTPSAAGAQKITISRGKLNELTANQEKLYEVKFAPVTIGTKIQGFRLIHVPNNHFLYEMGARSGDIIRRFNGQPLENTEKMFQMYQSLKTLNKVMVEIERSGKIIPFDIIIQ